MLVSTPCDHLAKKWAFLNLVVIEREGKKSEPAISCCWRTL